MVNMANCSFLQNLPYKRNSVEAMFPATKKW